MKCDSWSARLGCSPCRAEVCGEGMQGGRGEERDAMLGQMDEEQAGGAKRREIQCYLGADL